MGHPPGPLEPYPDTGCHLAPRCLTCPLPICVHDMADAGRSATGYRKGLHDVALLQQYEENRINLEGLEILETLADQESQTCRNILKRLANGRRWRYWLVSQE